MVILGVYNASQLLPEHRDNRLWQGIETSKSIIVGFILLSMSMAGCTKDANLPSAKQSTLSAVQVKKNTSTHQTGYSGGCAKIKASGSMPWRIKISANLLCAETKSRTANISFVDMASQMGMVISKGGVTLDVATSRLDDDVKRKFAIKGITITFISVKYNRLSLIIRNPALLDQLARIPEVRMIMAEYGRRTR